MESDPDRYRRSSDEFDCLMLELVLSAIVLGEPAAELRARLVEHYTEGALAAILVLAGQAAYGSVF